MGIHDLQNHLSPHKLGFHNFNDFWCSDPNGNTSVLPYLKNRIILNQPVSRNLFSFFYSSFSIWRTFLQPPCRFLKKVKWEPTFSEENTGISDENITSCVVQMKVEIQTKILMCRCRSTHWIFKMQHQSIHSMNEYRSLHWFIAPSHSLSRWPYCLSSNFPSALKAICWPRLPWESLDLKTLDKNVRARRNADKYHTKKRLNNL